MVSKVDESQVRARYEASGQDHVFKYIDLLSPTNDNNDVHERRTALLQQLDSIKVEDLGSLFQSAMADQQQQQQGDDNEDTPLGTITPFSKHVGKTTNIQETESAYEKGIDAIRNSEVAALVLAGGQGSRLGYDGPKGMYDIGLPSSRTLFQLLCERLHKLRQIATTSRTGRNSSFSSESDDNGPCLLPSIPFYIMTSPINHTETVQFFEANAYFGLPKEDVSLFEQGMLPCLTNEGKIIMETPTRVAVAPDGNGGIYPSLLNSGMLHDMTQRGIKFLHVFSIDNALTKIADPIFLGYCIDQDADCGNKVVWKAGPHEKVGVIAERSGKPCVVEYSEITTEMAERTESDGRLVFGAGNICNHFYTLDFLRDKVIPNLGNLYHVARKKIPYYDETLNETIVPTVENGIKLESFIFDIFPLSEKMAVLDTIREQEFAPVKNAPGSLSDSPDTARFYLSKQAQKWVIEAGGTLTGDLDSICEVAPLTSYGGEGLVDLVSGKEIICPFSL